MSMRCGIGRKIVVQSIPQRMEATSMVVVQTENQNLQNINGGTVKVLREVIGAVYQAILFEEQTGAEPDIKRVLNSKKVTDHHAIIPTIEITKTDLSAVP